MTRFTYHVFLLAMVGMVPARNDEMDAELDSVPCKFVADLSSEQPQLDNLNPGEKGCYGGFNDDTKLTAVQVYFKSITQKYRVPDVYNFSIPSVRLTCQCFCDVESKCDETHEETNECEDSFDEGEGQQVCVRKHFYQKCGPHNKLGDLCCIAMFYNDENDFNHSAYQAVFIQGPPVGNAEIIVTEKFKDGRIVKKTHLVQSDLAIRAGNFLIRVVTRELKNVIRSQWTFTEKKTKKLRVNPRVNGRWEFDITKLGWFKNRGFGKLHTFDANSVREALTVIVTDCKANEYVTNLEAFGWHRRGESLKTADLGTLLEDDYRATIAKADFEDGMVTVVPRETLPVVLTVTRIKIPDPTTTTTTTTAKTKETLLDEKTQTMKSTKLSTATSGLPATVVEDEEKSILVPDSTKVDVSQTSTSTLSNSVSSNTSDSSGKGNGDSESAITPGIIAGSIIGVVVICLVGVIGAVSVCYRFKLLRSDKHVVDRIVDKVRVRFSPNHVQSQPPEKDSDADEESIEMSFLNEEG